MSKEPSFTKEKERRLTQIHNRLLQNGGDADDVIGDDELLAEDGPSGSMDLDEDPTGLGGGDGGRA